METIAGLIVGIIAVIGAMFAVFKVGKNSGVVQAENKIAVDKANKDIELAEATANQNRKVSDAKAEISKADDDDVISRLRDDWSRD